MDVRYSVWVCDKLAVGEDVRTQLVRQLRAFSMTWPDIQNNGIVHDIIDPNLFSLKLSDNEILCCDIVYNK